MRAEGKRMLKAAVYIRMGNQNCGQSLLESQYAHYIHNLQERYGWDMAQVFIDQCSTVIPPMDRPGYSSMIEMCRRGEIELIVVRKIDAISRTKSVVLSSMKELQKMGVVVIAERKQLNTGAADTQLQYLNDILEENITWQLIEKDK